MDKNFTCSKSILQQSIEDITKKHELSNVMLVPRLEVIYLSIGAGKFFKNSADMEKLQTALSYIAGQKSVLTTAKKSVSSFDVREGMKTGLKVSLRRSRMYDFLDRLKIIYLPRIRDFKGLDATSFNGRSFSLGIKDAALTFPEIINLMNTYDFTFGMNITFVFNKENKILQQEFLESLGFPFK